MSTSQQKLVSQAMLYAPLVGLSAAALYQTYNILLAEAVPVDEIEETDEKQKRVQAVLDALQDDLEEKYPNGADTDPATKLLTKDFLLEFLLLKQQFKRLLNDVIPEANGNQRIKILRQKMQHEQSLQEAADDEEQQNIKKQIEETQRRYDMIILGEKKELDKAEADIHEIMMDHFNLIMQQYKLSIEAYSKDADFEKQLVEGREKIDKDYDEELKTEQVPQKLTRQMSMALLKQKEQSVNECVEAYRRQVTQRGYIASDAALLEASVLAAKARFDDQMVLQQGITGKQLMAAIMQNGVYEERMAEAKEVEEQQRQRQEEMMKTFIKYREEQLKKKNEETKQAKDGANKAQEQKKEADDSNIGQTAGWGSASVPSLGKNTSMRL